MKTEYLSSPCFGICKICEPSLIQVSVGPYTKTQYLNKILVIWSQIQRVFGCVYVIGRV